MSLSAGECIACLGPLILSMQDYYREAVRRQDGQALKEDLLKSMKMHIQELGCSSKGSF